MKKGNLVLLVTALATGTACKYSTHYDCENLDIGQGETVTLDGSFNPSFVYPEGNFGYSDLEMIRENGQRVTYRFGFPGARPDPGESLEFIYMDINLREDTPRLNANRLSAEVKSEVELYLRGCLDRISVAKDSQILKLLEEYGAISR